jgi:hypothetical protein
VSAKEKTKDSGSKSKSRRTVIAVTSTAFGILGVVVLAEAVTKKAGSGGEMMFAAFGLAALVVAFLIWAK